MKNIDLETSGWADYELLDSGDNRKLERYGKFVLIRPETQALWRPAHLEGWKRADAEFRFGEKEKGGAWRTKNSFPDSWQLSWNNAHFIARLTSFKHTGVFPEQEPNWKWMAERVDALASPRVLNLFGYTGIASLVAAKHGAEVTHCDASKQSNNWGRENAALSKLDTIRWITDDALKFCEREVRRGAEYDGIILDPPAFGRGANGEVFRIEEHLPKILDACAKLLARKPGAFFLLNGYAAGYAPQSFLQAAESSFPELSRGADANTHAEFGELHIKESSGERSIASGIYTRFHI